MVIRKYPICFSFHKYKWKHLPFKYFYFGRSRPFKRCWVFKFALQGYIVSLWINFNKEVFNRFKNHANKLNEGGG